jgi:hypothetical protein
MEGHGSRRLGIPLRPLAVVVTSVVVIGVASLVYLWPTIGFLHPASNHLIPRTATYASNDVIAESVSDAYLLQRPPGGGPSSANLYRTRDAGATWHRIALPALPSGFALVVTSLPEGKLFLRTFAFGFSTGAQQFYIGDGTTWTEITLPDPGTGSLQMIDARLGFYVATQTAGTPSVQDLLIYRTVDGGRSREPRLLLTADHPSGGGLRLTDDNRFFGFTDAMHAWLVVVPRSWEIVCGITSTKDPIQAIDGKSGRRWHVDTCVAAKSPTVLDRAGHSRISQRRRCWVPAGDRQHLRRPVPTGGTPICLHDAQRRHHMVRP